MRVKKNADFCTFATYRRQEVNWQRVGATLTAAIDDHEIYFRVYGEDDVLGYAEPAMLSNHDGRFYLDRESSTFARLAVSSSLVTAITFVMAPATDFGSLLTIFSPIVVA